ncbi:hypothetical protein, partial [Escherichia coli]|uniref:hypothetical protein n=1 Tax=Escherichia coli TaxID=562 RepID=UPI001A954B7C
SFLVALDQFLGIHNFFDRAFCNGLVFESNVFAYCEGTNCTVNSLGLYPPDLESESLLAFF